jgi:hypothetical protein
MTVCPPGVAAVGLKAAVSIAARTALVVAMVPSMACAPTVRAASTDVPMRTCTDASLAAGATETRRNPLYAVAELGYEAPDTARQYAVSLLSELERTFRLPAPIAFNAWVWPDEHGDSLTVPTMANEAMLTIGPDGRLVRVALSQASLVAAIDSALLSALRVALQSGGVLPPSVHGISNDLTIFVALAIRPIPGADRSPEESQPAKRPVMPMRRAVELPLLMLELPIKRFSTRPRIDLKRSAQPKYPDDLRQAGLEGDVEFEYVVGSDGLVVPQTIRVIGGTERRFAAAVVEALRGLRVVPGEIDGCPVSILASQRFSFRTGSSRTVEVAMPRQ